jgi:hypothetical protein
LGFLADNCHYQKGDTIMAMEKLPLSPEGKPYRLWLAVTRPVVKRYGLVDVRGCTEKQYKVYYVHIDIKRFWPAAEGLAEFSAKGAAVEYFTIEEFDELRKSGILVTKLELDENSRVLRGTNDRDYRDAGNRGNNTVHRRHARCRAC